MRCRQRLIASQAFIRGGRVVKTFSVYTVGEFFDNIPSVGVFLGRRANLVRDRAPQQRVGN